MLRPSNNRFSIESLISTAGCVNGMPAYGGYLMQTTGAVGLTFPNPHPESAAIVNPAYIQEALRISASSQPREVEPCVSLKDQPDVITTPVSSPKCLQKQEDNLTSYSNLSSEHLQPDFQTTGSDTISGVSNPAPQTARSGAQDLRNGFSSTNRQYDTNLFKDRSQIGVLCDKNEHDCGSSFVDSPELGGRNRGTQDLIATQYLGRPKYYM